MADVTKQQVLNKINEYLGVNELHSEGKVHTRNLITDRNGTSEAFVDFQYINPDNAALARDGLYALAGKKGKDWYGDSVAYGEFSGGGTNDMVKLNGVLPSGPTSRSYKDFDAGMYTQSYADAPDRHKYPNLGSLSPKEAFRESIVRDRRDELNMNVMREQFKTALERTGMEVSIADTAAPKIKKIVIPYENFDEANLARAELIGSTRSDIAEPVKSGNNYNLEIDSRLLYLNATARGFNGVDMANKLLSNKHGIRHRAEAKEAEMAKLGEKLDVKIEIGGSESNKENSKFFITGLSRSDAQRATETLNSFMSDPQNEVLKNKNDSSPFAELLADGRVLVDESFLDHKNVQKLTTQDEINVDKFIAAKNGPILLAAKQQIDPLVVEAQKNVEEARKALARTELVGEEHFPEYERLVIAAEDARKEHLKALEIVKLEAAKVKTEIAAEPAKEKNVPDNDKPNPPFKLASYKTGNTANEVNDMANSQTPGNGNDANTIKPQVDYMEAGSRINAEREAAAKSKAAGDVLVRNAQEAKGGAIPDLNNYASSLMENATKGMKPASDVKPSPQVPGPLASADQKLADAKAKSDQAEAALKAKEDSLMPASDKIGKAEETLKTAEENLIKLTEAQKAANNPKTPGSVAVTLAGTATAAAQAVNEAAGQSITASKEVTRDIDAKDAADKAAAAAKVAAPVAPNTTGAAAPAAPAAPTTTGAAAPAANPAGGAAPAGTGTSTTGTNPGTTTPPAAPTGPALGEEGNPDIMQVGGAAKKDGNLIDDNKFGMMAGLGGMAVMMLMGMDPMMAILGAVALFAAGNFFGDSENGILGNFTGTNDKAKGGHALKIEGDAKATVVGINGKGEIVEDKSKATYNLIGNVTTEKAKDGITEIAKLNVTQIQLPLKQGEVERKTLKADVTPIDLVADGKGGYVVSKMTDLAPIAKKAQEEETRIAAKAASTPPATQPSTQTTGPAQGQGTSAPTTGTAAPTANPAAPTANPPAAPTANPPAAPTAQVNPPAAPTANPAAPATPGTNPAASLVDKATKEVTSAMNNPGAYAGEKIVTSPVLASVATGSPVMTTLAVGGVILPDSLKSPAGLMTKEGLIETATHPVKLAKEVGDTMASGVNTAADLLNQANKIAAEAEAKFKPEDRTLASFDTNQDGVLSRKELGNMISKLDKDTDGKLQASDLTKEQKQEFDAILAKPENKKNDKNMTEINLGALPKQSVGADGAKKDIQGVKI